MSQEEAPPPTGIQNLSDQHLEDLAHRSAWHWWQALWWSALGVTTLNLPWLAGVAAGLGVYVLVGRSVTWLWGLERSRALRWRERLRVVKGCLTAVYPAATLISVTHWALATRHHAATPVAALQPPSDLSRWTALSKIFRISAHFERSPYSTGWVGETWMLAALLLAAVLHMVINELVFPADLFIGRKLVLKQIRNIKTGTIPRSGNIVKFIQVPEFPDRPYWFAMFVVIITFMTLLNASIHGGIGKGQLLDAKVNAIWPLFWWMVMSLVVLMSRIPRISSSQRILCEILFRTIKNREGKK